MSYARGEIIRNRIPTSPFYKIRLDERSKPDELKGEVQFLHMLTGEKATEMSFDELVTKFSRRIDKTKTLSADDIRDAKLLRQLRKDAENLLLNCYPVFLPIGKGKPSYEKGLLPKPYLVVFDTTGDDGIDWEQSSAEHELINKTVHFERTRFNNNSWQVCISVISISIALYLILDFTQMYYDGIDANMDLYVSTTATSRLRENPDAPQAEDDSSNDHSNESEGGSESPGRSAKRRRSVPRPAAAESESLCCQYYKLGSAKTRCKSTTSLRECHDCTEKFCDEHVDPDSHACDMKYRESEEECEKKSKEAEAKERNRYEVEQQREKVRQERATYRCKRRDCYALNDPLNHCKSCDKTFCDEHQHEHDCPNDAPAKLAEKRAAAKHFSRDICATMTPASSTSTRALTPASSTSTRALHTTSKAFKTPNASAPTLGAATGKRPADNGTSSNAPALTKTKKF